MNDVKVNILRRDNQNTESYWESFIYSGELHISVDALIEKINHQINEDSVKGNRPIGWECSCKQGICGSCAMVINEKPCLACQVFCDELLEKSKEIFIQPLSKFPVICDLKIDRSQMFEVMENMELWLNQSAQVNLKNLTLQYETSQCLMCGCCLEACPNYSFGGLFAGMPAAMAATNLSLQSTAEQFQKVYKERVFNRCSKSFACQSVCPMEIPIIEAMSKMNSISIWKIWKKFGGKK